MIPSHQPCKPIPPHILRFLIPAFTADVIGGMRGRDVAVVEGVDAFGVVGEEGDASCLGDGDGGGWGGLEWLPAW